MYATRSKPPTLRSAHQRQPFDHPGPRFDEPHRPTVPWAEVEQDGQVNVTDLLTLLGAWGSQPPQPADFSRDGTVNVTDLLALLAAWGRVHRM